MQSFKQESFPIVSAQVQEYGEIWCPPLEKNVAIGFCAESNLAFLVDCPSTETYDDYYHDDYWQKQSTLEHVMVARSRNKAKRRSKRVKLLKTLSSIDFGPDPRLLDVGCGLGFFCSYMLGSLSGTGSGIESSEYASNIAEKAGVKIVGRAVDQAWAAGNQDCFDVVSMIHVLEHIPNPNEMLRNLSQALRLDGKLIIEVPDLAAMKSINYKHPICYSTRSLYLLLNRNGFRIDGIQSTQSNDKFKGVITIIATNTREPLSQDEMPRNMELSYYIKNQNEFNDNANTGNFSKRLSSLYYTFRYLTFKYLKIKI